MSHTKPENDKEQKLPKHPCACGGHCDYPEGRSCKCERGNSPAPEAGENDSEPQFTPRKDRVQ